MIIIKFSIYDSIQILKSCRIMIMLHCHCGSDVEKQKVCELESCETETETEEKTKETVEFAARTFASQGQQRSAVLSLKLAEGEIIKNLCGEYPVYLFDDVLSELDCDRKKQLMSLFNDKQVMITCCDESSFDSSLVNNKIKVTNGIYSANK